MTSPTANIASLNGLHQLLRWPQQPDQPMQPLRLIIAPAGDEFVIGSDTQMTTAPINAHRLAKMLEYYPAPVQIKRRMARTLRLSRPSASLGSRRPRQHRRTTLDPAILAPAAGQRGRRAPCCATRA